VNHFSFKRYTRQSSDPAGLSLATSVFRLFSLAQRHTLSQNRRAARTFCPELTILQRQILNLFGVPENTLSRPTSPSG